MLKKLLTGTAVVGMLLTAAPVFADTTATPPVAPARRAVAACMKKATVAKRDAFKVAHERYRTALRAARAAKDRVAAKAAREAYAKELREAKGLFAVARKACTAEAPTAPASAPATTTTS